MKTNDKLPMADGRSPGAGHGARGARCSPAAFNLQPSTFNRRSAQRGFTLVELLFVIAIIAAIAALIFPLAGAINKQQHLKTARAELDRIVTALDGYYAKYRVYPPGNARLPNSYPTGTNTMYSQLYYELSGVTNTGSAYVTLDGAAQLPVNQVKTAFGVDGFINCSKGGGDEAPKARNFLAGLRANSIGTVQDNGVAVSNLVTAIRGLDPNYQPLGVPDVNPFRYVYPGVHNPNTYDLWIQLKISGKTNLICNWSSQTQINTADP